MKKKKVLPIIIGVIVIAAVLSNMKGKPKTGDAAVRSDTSIIVRNETKKDQNKTTTAPAEQADTIEEMTATEAATETAKTVETTIPTEPEEETEKVPAEYLVALASAESYLEFMPMSKAALYDQLTSEYGEAFDADAAKYAVDHVDANWKKNALKAAEQYSETMHMSKKGIYDQLISEYGEKFTKKQAQYAIDNIEADWKKNALESAKSYRDNMNMSKSAIYSQLVSEYGEQFTEEEAQYAIDHLDD